jgi:alpha-1,3-glucan synthase
VGAFHFFGSPSSQTTSGYSPLDFSVLDPHWGTLQDWQNTIDEIHARGMYFMADFTVGTMGDLIGTVGCVQIESYYVFYSHFSVFLNTSTPFDLNEHDAVWKHPSYSPWGFDEYRDFSGT